MLLSILATAALRLMTYNVLYSNPDPSASLDAIAKADPDIVLLQEVTSRWEAALEKRFAKQYPHRVFHVGSRAAGGIAVLSKVKITEEALWPAPKGTGAWFPAQRLVVDGPLGKVQILNVHLRPRSTAAAGSPASCRRRRSAAPRSRRTGSSSTRRCRRSSPATSTRTTSAAARSTS